MSIFRLSRECADELQRLGLGIRCDHDTCQKPDWYMEQAGCGVTADPDRRPITCALRKAKPVPYEST